MGGGGSAGSVSFPEYLMNTHNYLIHGHAIGGGYAEPDEFLIELLNDLWDPAANPYTGFAYTDPTSSWAESKARLDAIGTAIDSLDHETDWQSIFAAQLDSVINQARLPQVRSETVLSRVRTGADTSLSDTIELVEEYLGEGDDPSGEVTAYIDALVAKLDADGVLTGLDVADVRTNALAAATAALTAAGDGAVTGLNETTDWVSFLDLVNTNLTTFLTVRPDLDVTDIITSATTTAAAQVDAAIAKASAITAGTDLDDIISGFTNRQTARFNERLNAFTRGMADGNAVHSSTFIIGLAIIEASNQSDIAEFAGSLTLEQYRGAVGAYLQAIEAQIRAEIGIASNNAEQRGQFLGQALQGMVSMLVNRAQMEQAMRGLYMGTYEREVGADLTALGKVKDNRDQLLSATLQGAVQTKAQLQQYRQSLQGMFKDFFLGELESRIRAEVTNASLHTDVVRQATTETMEMLYRNLETDRGLAASLLEHNRLKYVTVKEYEDAELDIDTRFVTWNLDQLLKSTPIVGNLTGAGGVIPDRPSRAASAVGGALSGAATGATIGSAIPGVGTAIGAGVGGILGGLGGLL